MNNFFITGEKRCGKSTILNELISDPWFNNYRIQGYRTKSIVENHIVTGYQLEVIDGQAQYFAHIALPSSQQYDRYYINPDVFENLGATALTNARENADIILIDEVGVIEKDAPRWKKALMECLDSLNIVIGVFQKRARWFSEILIRRNDTQIFDISILNRNSIDLEILAEVKKNLSS